MKEEASSKGEDAFPMEMRSGWCPLASIAMHNEWDWPIVMQMHSVDNALSWTTRGRGSFSHCGSQSQASASAPSFINYFPPPPPLTPARPVFSSDPCTSQLPPPTFHSRAVDSPFPGNTPQKKFRRKRIQEEEEEEGQRGQKGAGPAWVGWKEDMGDPS